MPRFKRRKPLLPNLHWFIPVVGNWSFSIFYILSELWGSVVLSMLFWQFANEITKVTEAKRFYGLFGMIGNIGLLSPAPIIILTAKYAKSLPKDIDSFGVNLKLLMSCVLVSGLVAISTYWWMNKNVLTDPNLYQPGQGKKKEKAKLSVSGKLPIYLKEPVPRA